MIPVKLRLKNFMCYRDNVPPLSFEGIHVACLCGDNGNGKSALFDAMTWALWGESRARSQDDLVHLGQTEMEVELEFITRGQRYRVIRKYSKTTSSRAGQSDLQLQIATKTGFQPLTGNTIPETEKKIIDILHMDYDTFINSAFLVQGRADEFTRKRPSERKEILANILGLGVYDELEEKAKKLAREKEGEAEAIRSIISTLEAQLAHKKDYETELNQEKQKLTELEEKIKNYEVSLTELRRQKEFLDYKEQQLKEVEKSLKDLEKELKSYQEEVNRHRNKVSEYEQIISKQSEIEEGYSQFVAAKKRDDELNFQLSELLNLNEEIRKLEKIIDEAYNALILEQGVVQNQIVDRESKFEKLSQTEAEYNRIQSRLAELEGVDKEIANMKHHAQELIAEIQRLETNNHNLEIELKELEEKIGLLLKSDVRCPLCETELGMEKQAKLKAKLETEIVTKKEIYKNNREQIEKRKLEHQELEKMLGERETWLKKERLKEEGCLRVVEKEIAEAKQAGMELSERRARLKEIERRLRERDYASEAQQKLLELKKERDRLGYDKEEHQDVKERLLKFQKYDEQKQRLEEAKRLIGDERADLVSAEKRVSYLEQKIKKTQQEKEELIMEVASLPEIVNRLNEVEETYQELKKTEQEVRDNVSRLKERLDYCSQLEESKRKEENRLRKSLNEAEIYTELAKAFGKNGIQALLIERALPEIEVEANRLLGKMTDNRMSVRLETQRETKKGGVIEALDIKIADELGTRNYEMYSGGESFRINLALRIALSKLLVRRAGASLPILIIDEGFGTQDGSGREKLVEAINSIQDDFEKILVITHLEEIKDAFPVRINVIKTPAGSTFFMD